MACTTALKILKGANSHAANPLPGTPFPRTHSMGNPLAGTNRDSIRAGTPSHTTGTPRSRSTFATLRAGNTCPPVPPAMMSTGPWLIGVLPACASPPHASCTSLRAGSGEGQAKSLGGQPPYFAAIVAKGLTPQPHAEGQRQIGLEFEPGLRGHV